MQRIYQNRIYHWNGKVWLDRDFLQVPEKLAGELSAHYLDELLDPGRPDWMETIVHLRRAGEDLANRATLRLVARACRARLAVRPDESPTVALLSSALRHLGQPARAEEVTRAYLDPAVLTSRAAALCDLGLWEEAKKTVALALRHGGGKHALQVRGRIHARRG
ncbi:MAG: hypothetical protein KF760_10125 [Candidatus Eremiobacteraeota bacterium]|nr:hypothetical protein [Candidatus Eremiobacteraeota bacterium]MCW5867712.1 hypothetical protein [Candidatus Eremiobacteraeota bacterium]